MTKTKTTKRSLVMSALALFICVSMLIGSTYAWFTDTVTSSGNKIQSGTLKIDLEMLDKDGTWSSIKDSEEAIFDYQNWEPGYTDVKVLKVENEGTLALKWMAKFVSAFELTALADVIDVYVCPSETEIAYPADRNLDGYERVGTVAEFVNTIETTTTGKLEAGDSAYLGIALKMQESAGNEYQGMDLGGEFDIMIMATQLTSEEDSFDDQYDKDAKYTAEVDTFKANLAAAKAGDTVTFNLTQDAYLGEGEKLLAPVGVNVVINGNGHTIYADNATHVIAGQKDTNITINDLTVVGKTKDDAIISQNGGVGTVNIVMNNVTVNLSDITGVPNWPVCLGGSGTATLTNCVITGAGLPSGDYADGNQFFAGALMNVTVVNSKIDSIMLNGSKGSNSATLNVDADSQIGTVYLEAQDPSVVTGSVASVKEMIIPVKTATDLKSALESAVSGVTVVVYKNIDMNGATVALADGVKLVGEGDVAVSNALFNVADDPSASFADIEFTGATTVEAKGDGALNFTDCEFNVTPNMYNSFSRGAAIIGANQNYTLDLYLEGCTFNYTEGSVDKWNAAIFMWSNVDDCVIKNCTFNDYGFMAIKLMNVAVGAEITFEGNTFNMCETTAANYFNNNAVQIMPQHDNALSVKFVNNTFTGDYRDGTMVAKIEVMHGTSSLSNLTFEQSGNTLNGATVTDANFAINAQ